MSPNITWYLTFHNIITVAWDNWRNSDNNRQVATDYDMLNELWYKPKYYKQINTSVIINQFSNEYILIA